MLMKITRNIMNTMFLFMALFYCTSALAYNVDNCVDIAPAHISAVMNVRMAKYYNNQMIRGDYHITSSTPLVITAQFDGNTYCMYAINFETTAQAGTLTTDSQGNPAWQLTGTGYAIEPFVDEPRCGGYTVYIPGDHFMGTSCSIINEPTATMAMGVDVVSASNWSPSVNQLGTMQGTVVSGGQVIVAGRYQSNWGGGWTDNLDLVYLDSLTINTTTSSCGIRSRQGSVVNWPSLYAEDILNGEAVDTKPYSLTLVCGQDSDPKTKVTITVNAANGNATNNADRNVVNTGLSGIGLKLTWQNPSLPPLDVTAPNISDLSGEGDYTVLAKPVLTGETITPGAFDTNVTLSIDFN